MTAPRRRRWPWVLLAILIAIPARQAGSAYCLPRTAYRLQLTVAYLAACSLLRIAYSASNDRKYMVPFAIAGEAEICSFILF